MANLATQTMAVSGLNPTYVTAGAGGDTAAIGGKVFLHVSNGGAVSTTVTVDTPGTIGGLAIGNAAVVIAAGADAFIPMATVYKQPTTLRAAVTYSATASVNVAVIQLP